MSIAVLECWAEKINKEKKPTLTTIQISTIEAINIEVLTRKTEGYLIPEIAKLKKKIENEEYTKLV